MSSTRTSCSSLTTELAVGPVPGARSLALSLAWVPTLFATVSAQGSDVAAGSAGTPPPKDKDTVELDPMEVQAQQVKDAMSSAKFTQPLLDMPQTVAVVPQEVFNLQGAQTLSDVLRNTPGITFTAGEGGAISSGDTFTMRGFDTSGSVFVDGVRDTSTSSRDVYNVEQVEIAKGPAGADTGRGGASGYVNLATKTPQQENFARGTASYGVSEHAGEDQRRTTLDVNRTLGADANAAFRLNMFGEDSGVSGRDVTGGQSWGVAPSFAAGLGTPTRVIFRANYEEQDNIPDSGVPAVAVASGLYLDRANVPALPTGSIDPLVPVSSPLTRDIMGNFYGLDSDYERVTQRGASVRFEHDYTPDLKLTNQTKVADTERDALTTFLTSGAAYNATTNRVGVTRSRVVTDNQIVSNQTNVAAAFDTGPVAHAFSAGLELSRETQYRPTYTAPTAANLAAISADVYNPDPSRPVTAAHFPTRAPNNPFNDARIDTAAIYAFDTLELHKKLLLNLSGRLERYKNDYASLAADTTAPFNVTPVKMQGEGDLFSWKSGLVFKPVPAGSFYVAYGTSSTPPGTSFTLSTTAGNANNPATDPQEAENYEVGVKWNFFENRLSTSLAAYQSVNGNIATNIGTTAAPVIVYDQERRTEGLEFGVSGRITPEWLVFGGVGLIDSEIDSPSTAATDGSGLRFTPRVSGSLFTTYALTRRLTIGGGAEYSESVTRSNNSTVNGSISNTTDSYVLLEAPDYWLFNALAAYALNDHLTVRLNVNNLLDEEYYRLNNNGGRIFPGSTRTWVLSADYAF